jgi:DNA-binding SARP family transcriptional activator
MPPEPESIELPGRPWPLRIYALGTFRVRREEEPLHAGRKAQRRVLELLQAITVLGPRGASRDALVAALWPDAEGDAGHHAFEITLHRLRRLLGMDDAVRLDHGQVVLDPRAVWVDTEAFLRLAEDVERNPIESPAGHATLARKVDKALTLYAGPLLQNEQERAWVLAPRERLRIRFLRFAHRAAEKLLAVGLTEHAVDALRHAIEIDPLAEDLHRRLIAAFAAAGRRAEAVDAYRHCERLLSKVLGVRPSPETERAYAQACNAAGTPERRAT